MCHIKTSISKTKMLCGFSSTLEIAICLRKQNKSRFRDDVWIKCQCSLISFRTVTLIVCRQNMPAMAVIRFFGVELSVLEENGLVQNFRNQLLLWFLLVFWRSLWHKVFWQVVMIGCDLFNSGKYLAFILDLRCNKFEWSKLSLVMCFANSWHWKLLSLWGKNLQ